MTTARSHRGMNLKVGIIISFVLGGIEALGSNNNGVPTQEPTFSPVDIRIPLGLDENSAPETVSPVESASQTNQVDDVESKVSKVPTTAESDNQNSATDQNPTESPVDIQQNKDKKKDTPADTPKHDSTWCPTNFSGKGNACGPDMPSGTSWIQCAYSESDHLQTCTCSNDDPFWRCKGNEPNSEGLGTDASEPSIESKPGQNTLDTDTTTQPSTGGTNDTQAIFSTEESNVSPPANPTGRSDDPNSSSTTTEPNTDGTSALEESPRHPSSNVSDESESDVSGSLDSTGNTEGFNSSITSESQSEPPSNTNSTVSNESSSTTPGNSSGEESGTDPIDENKSSGQTSQNTTQAPSSEVPNPVSNETVVSHASESPVQTKDVDTSDGISSNRSPSTTTDSASANDQNIAPSSTPVNSPSLGSPSDEIGSPAIVPSLPPSSSGHVLSQQLPPGMFVKRTSPPVQTETPTNLPTISKVSNTDVLACREASTDTRRNIVFEYLSSLSGTEAMNDTEHPAFMAGSWIADEDVRRLCPGDPNFIQRYVLALLYFSTSGDDWMKCTRNPTKQCANSRYLSDSNECNWGGVTCDSEQRITNLNLDENNMQGSIPHEMRYLEHLYELDLDSNNLVGHIPSWFGAMKYLEKLDLDRNVLSGPIPEELYSSTTLKFLDVDRNILSGTISSNIGSMSQLVFFQADFNQLIGTIPTEVSKITELQYFSIFGNGFDESVGIPSEICGFYIQIYANCEMCEEVGDCCTVCLPEDTSHLY